ncbi:MAG: tyrosine-type recombinase/integrase [Eubacteriales bacterium]|nr:tyrosine-type recombinase/integrase [Eubacteriales bacterium]
MYDTAARVSEALNVRLCDLHMDASIPHVTFFGKGRKYRNVPLMDSTIAHLKRYLREFHGSDYQNTGTPLFYAMTHGKAHRLSIDTPEKMIKRYAKELSETCRPMSKNVHCHMIRKTRACICTRKASHCHIFNSFLDMRFSQRRRVFMLSLRWKRFRSP